MQRFRTVLFWCHLVAGLAAGIVILVMSVTGVLLTYEKQMIHWADTRAIRVAPPAVAAPRLDLDTLITRVRSARPEAVVEVVTVRHDAGEPVALVLARAGTLYVDPYTGAALGTGSPGVRAFFRSVTDWHRWLAMSGTRRATGRAITGAANLAFLFIVCSGIYLWFPRVWRWVQFRNVLWFRRRLAGKARDFNWHNVAGVWCAVPLAIIVASGVVISYPWAGNLVYRLAGEAPPPPRGQAGPGPAGRRAEAGPPVREAVTDSAARPAMALEALWARAASQAPDWQTIALRLPSDAGAPALFTIDRGGPGQPHLRAQLALDTSDGRVIRWEPFSSFTRGRQLRSILRFAHTGEILGPAGQTIAGVVSAAAALLVYTGLALSLRRFAAWRRRTAERRVHTVAPADGPAAPRAAARRAEAPALDQT